MSNNYMTFLNKKKLGERQRPETDRINLKTLLNNKTNFYTPLSIHLLRPKEKDNSK